MFGNMITKEKIKTAFKPFNIAEFAFILLVIGSLLVKCFYFQFTTRLNERPFRSGLNINMLLASLASLVIVFSFFLLIFNKKRKTAILILDIFLSLLLFSDTLYFRYYYNAITVPVLYQIGLVGSVGDSVLNLLKIKDIVYGIDFPFFIAYLIIARKTLNAPDIKMKIAARLIAAILIFAAGFFTFRYTYDKSSYEIFPYDNNYVINNLGVLYFHYYDVSRFLKDNYFTDRTLSAKEGAQLTEYYQNRKKSGDKYKGIAKGKNLIIVQAEAFQDFVVNMEFNGQEVTPNLNRYMNESVYFDNFFYQIGGGNTSDAEFLCNTSLYPVRDGAVYFRFPTNLYHTLPKALKNEGYHTYVAHANNPSFWNRAVMYDSLGFDTFLNNKDFVLDDTRGWGLSDVSFFRQSLDKIDKTEPFYAFLVTLSSHHPYNYFDDYKGFDPGQYSGTFLGNYLKAAHYVDYAIGELIKDLKSRRLYDDTVLVIYGDHSAVQKDQWDNLKKLVDIDNGDDEFDWNMLQKVPLFIHFPGLDTTGTITAAGGQVDIFPTAANLLGIEAPYALGKDLFNIENSYAVLRNGNVVTENYVYLSGFEEVYDLSGKLMDGSKFKDEIKSLQRELSISDIIVRKDAFRKIEK